MTTIYGVACLHKCLFARKPHLSTETGDFAAGKAVVVSQAGEHRIGAIE